MHRFPDLPTLVLELDAGRYNTCSWLMIVMVYNNDDCHHLYNLLCMVQHAQATRAAREAADVQLQRTLKAIDILYSPFRMSDRDLDKI